MSFYYIICSFFNKIIHETKLIIEISGYDRNKLTIYQEIEGQIGSKITINR